MKTELEKLIEKWEIEKGSYIPNSPIYQAFIDDAKESLKRESKVNKYFSKKYNELKKEVDKTRKINRIKSQKSYWFETLSLFVDGCLSKEECKQYQNELS